MSVNNNDGQKYRVSDFQKDFSDFAFQRPFTKNQIINYRLRLDTERLIAFCSFELETWFHLFILFQ